MIFFMTLFFAALASIPSFAMQEGQQARPRTREEQIAKWAPKAAPFVKYHLRAPAALPEDLAPYCPSPIPSHTECLTDAMFLALPAVQKLQALDSKAKKNQLRIACKNWQKNDVIYYAKRCHVAACVTAGANPNGFQYYDAFNAIYEQDFALVRFLLEHGANLNYPIGPLITSARNKYMAKLLHSYGAELDTSLLDAATWADYSPKLLAWYIKQGIDVNAQESDLAMTPLHSLATRTYLSSYSIENVITKCTMLLDAGAKTNIENKCKNTFFYIIYTLATYEVSPEEKQKYRALIALTIEHPNHPDNCSLQKR